MLLADWLLLRRPAPLGRAFYRNEHPRSGVCFTRLKAEALELEIQLLADAMRDAEFFDCVGRQRWVTTLRIWRRPRDTDASSTLRPVTSGRDISVTPLVARSLK